MSELISNSKCITAIHLFIHSKNIYYIILHYLYSTIQISEDDTIVNEIDKNFLPSWKVYSNREDN